MKNITIDAKSVVIGIGLGIGVMFGLGASTPNPHGRYQITSAGNYLAVIDSETGQVWAGNFSQQGPNVADPFRNCPQNSGDLFHAKSQ